MLILSPLCNPTSKVSKVIYDDISQLLWLVIFDNFVLLAFRNWMDTYFRGSAETIHLVSCQKCNRNDIYFVWCVVCVCLNTYNSRSSTTLSVLNCYQFFFGLWVKESLCGSWCFANAIQFASDELHSYLLCYKRYKEYLSANDIVGLHVSISPRWSL